ncbi:MAG TPA: hypothetical protein VIV40_38035 [Kofleriaceae bacterium]
MKRWLWLIVACAVWLQCRSGRTCKLAESWHAPPPHYDYFQSIELRADGTGHMAMGEGQMVRSDVKVQYSVKGRAMTLHYVAGSQAASRTIPFRLEEGDFVVEEPDYDRTRRRHFRCRLRFAENPFPPDAMSDDHRDYYACER